MGSGMWVAAESWMSCGHFSYEYFGRNEQRGLLFVFFSLVVKNEEAFCLSHWGGNFEAGSMPSTSRFMLMLIEGVTLRLPTRTLLAPYSHPKLSNSNPNRTLRLPTRTLLTPYAFQLAPYSHPTPFNSHPTRTLRLATRTLLAPYAFQLAPNAFQLSKPNIKARSTQLAWFHSAIIVELAPGECVSFLVNTTYLKTLWSTSW